MNPQAIFEKLDQCTLALGRGNTQLKISGLDKAKTEMEYRVAYNKKMLELKAEKCQATLIVALAKSDPIVADLAMKKDIAESAYFTCISAIENLRLETLILRTKISWLKAEMGNS